MKQLAFVFKSLLCCAATLMVASVATTRTALADSTAPTYVPTIDIFPTASFAAGADEFGQRNGLPQSGIPGNNGVLSAPNGDLKFNAVYSQPLLRNLNFQYEYDNRTTGIANASGTVTNAAGAFVIPGVIADVVNEFRLSYQRPRIGLQLGTYYRYRVCCPATNAASNLTPADYHAQYLQLTLKSPSIAALNGTIFSASARGTYNFHHASAAGIAKWEKFGFQDRDSRPQFGINYGVSVNVPIDRKNNFAIFATQAFGPFNFYDNVPVPFYYDLSDIGLTKRFNKILSFTADVNNLTQINRSNGVPYLYPNAIHRVILSTSFDIHLAP